jgi:hypothetical protein
MLVAVWAVVVFGVVVSVILALAGLAGVGFLVRARSNWRRALARPIPDHGLNGWLWRQPGWRLALIIWAFQVTAAGLIVVGLAYFMHSRGLAASTHGRAPQFPAASMAVVVIGMAVTAVGQAAAWCVIRRRQAAAPH